MELGKTAEQYYEELAARDAKPTKTEVASVRETLLSRESEDGFEISVIEGKSRSGYTYE
jgi:hypothetical protein